MTSQTSQEIRSQLDQAQRDLLNLPKPMPFLPALRARRDDLAATLAVDPENAGIRADLKTAIEQLEQGIQVHAENARLSAAIKTLTLDLDQAIADERLALNSQKHDAFAKAHEAHRKAVYEAVTTYRKLINAHRIAGRTDRLPAFHSSLAQPVGWQGNTSDAMQQGLLPLENWLAGEKAA